MNTTKRIYNNNRLIINIIKSSNNNNNRCTRLINNSFKNVSYLNNSSNNNSCSIISCSSNSIYNQQKRNMSRYYGGNIPNGQNESTIESVVFILIGIGAIALLGYVLYDGLEEMIIENIMYNQTVEQLRGNSTINKVFKEFSAHGLGIRAQFSIKKSLEDPNIFNIYYTIRSEGNYNKDLVGYVSAKLHRVSIFKFETDTLKVTYGNGKVITIISEEKKLARELTNRAQKMFSFLIPSKSNNNNNNNNNNKDKSNVNQQDQGLLSTVTKLYNDISNYFSNDPPKDK